MNTPEVVGEGRFSDRNTLRFISRHSPILDSETDIENLTLVYNIYFINKFFM